MSNVIEMEKSFILPKNYDNILENIKNNNFNFVSNITEEDTYFTDEKEIFIKNRTCLRTRKTNETSFELTYKPKTDNSKEEYGKKEVNISLNPKDSVDLKYILSELGYKEYVSFIKHRTIYEKQIDNIPHNIMIDKIDGVGSFIELEILVHTEKEQENCKSKLDDFVKLIGCEKLKDKNKPYRDLVKEKTVD